MMNDMDLLTWDVIVKCTPRLPQLEILLHKNLIKKKKFFTVYNDFQYNPPFLIFYSKKATKETESQLPQDMSL